MHKMYIRQVGDYGYTYLSALWINLGEFGMVTLRYREHILSILSTFMRFLGLIPMYGLAYLRCSLCMVTTSMNIGSRSNSRRSDQYPRFLYSLATNFIPSVTPLERKQNSYLMDGFRGTITIEEREFL
jgi:hypothetical protein